MVSADSFLQQADRQGTVVTRTRDGIAVLKGEIKLDEFRNTDTERKQAELKKMEQQEQRETEFQCTGSAACQWFESVAGGTGCTTKILCFYCIIAIWRAGYEYGLPALFFVQG